jgi:hypothetical protein
LPVFSWVAKIAMKNDSVLRKAGICFAAPKIITKGAKILRKLAEK